MLLAACLCCTSCAPNGADAVTTTQTEEGFVFVRTYGDMTGSEWVEDAQGWKCINAEGTFMEHCWARISGKWYFFDNTGYMQTGWQTIDGKRYYFKDSGAMATGWVKTADRWYYLKRSGEMVRGWQAIGGKWYYFFPDGTMATGWITLGETDYYFEEDGAWVEER